MDNEQWITLKQSLEIVILLVTHKIEYNYNYGLSIYFFTSMISRIAAEFLSSHIFLNMMIITLITYGQLNYITKFIYTLGWPKAPPPPSHHTTLVSTSLTGCSAIKSIAKFSFTYNSEIERCFIM